MSRPTVFPIVYINKKPGPFGEEIVADLCDKLDERFEVRLRQMHLEQNRAYLNSQPGLEAIVDMLEPHDSNSDRYIFIITDYRSMDTSDAMFAELYREAALHRGCDFISVILEDNTPERSDGDVTESTGVDGTGTNEEAAERTAAPTETAEPAETRLNTPLYTFDVPHELRFTMVRSNLHEVAMEIAQYVNNLFPEREGVGNSPVYGRS
ncbi:MAG: hypothetical protein Q9197_001985 [Variospora fuerteventurae]